MTGARKETPDGTALDCARARARLGELFIVGGLPTAELQAHLDGCRACREHRERLARVDVSLAGQPAEAEGALLGALARESIRAAVLGSDPDGGESALAPEPRPDPPPVAALRGPAAAQPRPVRPWRVLVAGLVGATALTVILLWRTSDRPGLVPGDGPGAARGGGEGFASRRIDDGTAMAALPRGLRALCVVDGPTGPRIHSLDDGRSTRAECTVRDRLGLAYRNETDRPAYVAIFLRSADGRLRAIHPRRTREPLPPTPAEAPEVPLDEPVMLEVREAGRLEILAHFAAAPLDSAAVRARLELERGSLPADTLRLVVGIGR